MAEARDVVREVRLRPVEDADLGVFFGHQADPEANEMAAFPARGEEQFAAHWERIRADDIAVLRTIVADGTVAGYITSWEQEGQRLIAYWVGREQWGRGVATYNAGSIRVLEKCGFRRDRVQEATAPASDDGIEELIFVLDA
jgi:RimJ/RimL family protein N-acetyltransferase